MLAFTLIAFVILIAMVASIKSNLLSKIDELSRKIDNLKKQLSQLNVPFDKKSEKAAEQPIPPVAEEIKKEEPKPVIKEIPKPQTQPEWASKKERPVEVLSDITDKDFLFAKKEQPKVNVKPPKLSFFEKNPDLEKFIGENLINKIGIAILVLGIGFFVKFAIDKDWINEIGRTAIGVLCGGILIGLAHRLRKTFAAFSSVLVGGGLAILYFTISIAFHQYQLFSQTVAFIIMVVITGFSVLLSISYDRKELAILAIVGGFSSPFMLSTGEGNYVVLFSYITILNVGMLTLAYFKKWDIITIISYVFTILLYGAWLVTKIIMPADGPYFGALLFATIFYLIFFLMNIINNVKENRKFNALDISMLLSNTFIYFSAGMAILYHIQEGRFQGLFTATIAVFNFIFSYALYKSEKVDRNLVFLLIGLVLTFLSLAAPIQLEGNHITLFWSAEAVLLLWLSQKSGIQLMKRASVIVMFLMFISLIMDWYQIYFSFYEEAVLPVLFNKGFITGVISVTGIFCSILLLKKEGDNFIINKFKASIYKNILSIVMLVFLYVTLLLELRYQLDVYIAFDSTRDIIIGCYNYLFLIGLSFLAIKNEKGHFLETTIFMNVAAILCYLLFYHKAVIDIRDAYLISGEANLGSFLFHYINVALILILLVITYRNIQSRSAFKADWNNVIMWYTSFVLIFIASAELDHIIVMKSYYPGFAIDPILEQNHKIGFPILWGVCSFILMSIGMRVKRRDLRIISLTLFFITLVKLFAFDIRGISEGGKIAAFISLGVLLLIISFMYQKLKKLILEDDKIKTE